MEIKNKGSVEFQINILYDKEEERKWLELSLSSSNY